MVSETFLQLSNVEGKRAKRTDREVRNSQSSPEERTAYDVEHSGREGLSQQFAEQQRGEGSVWTGLQHHRVAWRTAAVSRGRRMYQGAGGCIKGQEEVSRGRRKYQGAGGSIRVASVPCEVEVQASV